MTSIAHQGKRLAAIALGVLVAGCATNQGYLSPNTGVALREAYAKQIVDPNPVPGAPKVNVEKAQAAIARYLADDVKDPSPESGSFLPVQ